MSLHHRSNLGLTNALRAVIGAASDLAAAIDGVTGQLDAERRALKRAIAIGQQALAADKAGAA